MNKRWLVLVLLVVLLCGCYSEEDMGAEWAYCTKVAAPYSTSLLLRCTDAEAEIVCWVYDVSLWCMPLDQTALEGVRE